MGGCSANRCTNSNAKGWRMYRFPKDQKRRREWERQVDPTGTWKSKPNGQLCAVHFDELQFEARRADGVKKLKPNAVPTCFDSRQSDMSARPPLKERFLQLNDKQLHSHQPAPLLNHASGCNTEPRNLLYPTTMVASQPPAAADLPGWTSVEENGVKACCCPVGSVSCACHCAKQMLAQMCYPQVSDELQHASGHQQPSSQGTMVDSLMDASSVISASPVLDCTANSSTSFDTQTQDENLLLCGGGSQQDKCICGEEEGSGNTLEVQPPSSTADCVAGSGSSMSQLAHDKERQLLLERIKQLERKRKRQQKEIRALRDAKESLNRKLKAVFNDDQLAALTRTSNRGSKWSEKTIKKALQLHFSCGTSGYSDLLSQNHPLPSSRTLRRRVEGIKFQPGLLQEVFDLLAVKACHMRPQERFCLLMIDEMALQQRLEYDPSTGSVRGYATLPVPGKETKAVATHGLVFMLCGISTRWKQVVAYHYTGDSFSGIDAGNVAVSITERCTNIGLHVLAITTDMGPGNRSMWQHFKVNAGRFSTVCNIVKHPSLEESRIRVLADVPHIVKNLCGHLIRGQSIVLHPDDVTKNELHGCVISLEPVRRLVKFQEESTFKLAPKLRKEVVDPSHFDKMKVSIAMAVFSHSTAVALKTMVADHNWPEHYLVTAWFIQKVNHWFNLMCSRHPVMALSLHSTEKHKEAVMFLESFMEMFRRLKIGDGHFKPCQAGVLLSTTSIIQLQDHLLNDLSFEFVLTSRFTQDSLENFFSTVRLRNPIPTPLEFKMALKIISISQYLKVSTTGSYEVDDGAFFLADFDTSNALEGHQPDADDDNITYGRPHLSRAEESAFFYYCGYVISRVLKNNLICKKCESDIIREGPSSPGPSEFTKRKDYKADALVCPSDKTYEMFLTCESCFVGNIGNCLTRDNIIPRLHRIMSDAVVHVTIEPCHGIKDKLIRRFCHARLQLHLDHLSRKSVTKAKDMGSKSMSAPRRQR